MLKFNKFDAIDANAFQPMTKLKNVEFSFNELTSLPGGLFSQNIKLHGNKLGFTSSDIFDNKSHVN